MSERVYHWRRHPESITSDRIYTTPLKQNQTYVASACGRLVEYQTAVGDPENADCAECVHLAFFIPSTFWFRKDEERKRFEEKWRAWTKEP